MCSARYASRLHHPVTYGCELQRAARELVGELSGARSDDALIAHDFWQLCRQQWHHIGEAREAVQKIECAS
jgi:hypothetical protein